MNTSDSWIHDTAASAAMSWAQDEPWDVGYGSSIPYQSYFTVAHEATSPDLGNDSFGCLLESGGKDCDVPEALIAQAKHECLMARLDTWKPVQMSRNPLYVILDIGCTRAMGSRPAVEALAQAAPAVGIWCEFLPTYTVFSFANSAQTVVKEKCRIWFPTSPPCSTDIDICEEGTVPVLFSLPQMRMLSLSIEPTPEGVF